MNQIRYQGAFDCANCPMSNDPAAERSCPAWWDWIEAKGEGQAKEFRPNAACGLQVGGTWMKAMMANNDFTTINAVELRDKVTQQMNALQQTVHLFDARVQQLLNLTARAAVDMGRAQVVRPRLLDRVRTLLRIPA